MRAIAALPYALLLAASLVGGPASANTCQAEGATCPTTMPAGGYCECKLHGEAKGGTVVQAAAPHAAHHAASAGCPAGSQAKDCAAH